MKPQLMGVTVASLEEQGLVTRKPHPTDERQIYIELTIRGAVLQASARSARHTWLALAIAQLDEREKSILFEAGEILRRLAAKV